MNTSDHPVYHGGDPAFPANIPVTAAGHNVPFPGMSLRDWLAGQALAGLCVSPGDLHAKTCASFAYEMADAMLEAREK